MLRDITCLPGYRRNHDPAQPFLAEKLSLHRRERGEDNVILVLSAARADSFGCKHPHNLEGQSPDADGLSDRVAGAKGVLSDCSAEHCHRGGLGYVVFSE